MREPAQISPPLHGRVTRGAFVPHPLLRNAHVQTLLTLLRPMPRLAMRVERVETADGDFVDLGWCGEEKPGTPLVVLLHGLTGGFESKYLRGVARQFVARGWRAVILRLRGAGPEPNRLTRHYHQGDTGDLRELVKRLREREPHTRLLAVGWSLGANVLLKYLGEEGERTALHAAVAVCAPYRLHVCAERLGSGFSRVYQRHLMGELTSMLKRKHAITPLPLDWARVEGARDFVEFDSAATAPLNGFRDAHDYYDRCESAGHLGGIRRPVLAIHALDDPFMRPDIVPAERDLPPGFTLELCERGGHVGFAAAGPLGGVRWWLEQRIPQFLEEHAA